MQQTSAPVSRKSNRAHRRVWWPLALALAAACTVPNPNYRGKGGDAAPDDPTAKELTSLVFLASNNPGLAADVTAVIDGTTAKATVPFGRNQSLVATFAITGARVEVAGVPQESGVTGNAFGSPVVYHVIAGDGSTQDYTVTVATPVQQAYVKGMSKPEPFLFGRAVAMSADGNTLAVAAYPRGSMGNGVVYMFARSDTGWSQQGYLKASNETISDQFGGSMALSADGNTLAVGATGEDSSATGIDSPPNGTIANSGAVYVFTRSATAWSQQAYIKASNTNADDNFGYSVALSADGNTLAVGATGEDSSATGTVGADRESSNAASNAGAVYAFTRSSGAWGQQAYIKASNTNAEDNFGHSVALSADGNTLAVGAIGEDSNATGTVGADRDTNNSASSSGAVYAFTRSSGAWAQQAYIKASNTDADDTFGFSVALSADGNTLAVGAVGEDSNATGTVGAGRENSNSASNAGAVYAFTRSSGAWAQQAYIKASNGDADDTFGLSVAISADGITIATGAPYEDSAAKGVNDNNFQSDNSKRDSGAVYVFH